jgi:hypothetical protein
MCRGPEQYVEHNAAGCTRPGTFTGTFNRQFAANPATGTDSMTVPIAASPGRSGFGPALALAYDSGRGNSVFGFDWSLALPAVIRRTDKGLPRYDETDVFLISDAEDLVPTRPTPVGYSAGCSALAAPVWTLCWSH